MLGVTLDSTLTLSQHVTNIVRACTLHTRALRHIRLLLTVSAVKVIAAAIVGARLDYCNSLLYGAPEYKMDRLQHMLYCHGRPLLQKRDANYTG